MRRQSHDPAPTVLILAVGTVLASGVSAGKGKVKASNRAEKFPHVDLFG